jgi:hypothetical protein
MGEHINSFLLTLCDAHLLGGRSLVQDSDFQNLFALCERGGANHRGRGQCHDAR